MAEKTAISWVDSTWNPWHGCNEVSAGCDHCYARQLSERWGHHVWGPPATTPRRFFGDKHWQEPLRWNKAAEATGERRRVFCASMADVFEFDPTGELDHQRERLWSLIEATPWLDWLLLTKRPEQISQMLPRIWLLSPRKNVWLGTSVENQAAADLRIPRLLAVPAVVHWLSCEPLLGPVDLTRIRTLDVLRGAGPDGADVTVNAQHNTLTGAWFDGWDRGVRDRRIAWVIVGGESGPNYRPMDLDWARSLRDQCQLAGAAFFYKQGASRLPGRDTELDGWTWHEWPAVTA